MRTKIYLWSACLGNLFEHYDTALFGFLSPFLAPLIFPQHDLLTALILTYAMIPLGMLARPLGSLFFGYVGDLYGRGVALFWTMLGMGIVSLGIACTPLYEDVGLVSPLIFCFGRVLQNFLSAGESMGGAIFVLENTEEKKHDLMSSVYNASTIAGILLASGAVVLMGLLGFEWRILYVAGSITALFGCLLRKGSKHFDFPQKGASINLWKARYALFLIMLCSGFAYANYSIALVFINGFIPLISDVTKEQMMELNTFLLVFDFCLLPVCGFLASKISREKMMMFAALAVVCGSMPLMFFLHDASLLHILLVRICLVIVGVAFFAPFHAWAAKLVPPTSRYAVVSLGYSLGSQLLGGGTAALSLWFFKTTGQLTSVCWYWMALGAAATVAIALSKKQQVHA